jgi:glycine cleavage system H lipoate-binding protein
MSDDSYDGGWLMKIKAVDAGQYDQSMDQKAFLTLLKG